jgi:hypothetical protein
MHQATFQFSAEQSSAEDLARAAYWLEDFLAGRGFTKSSVILAAMGMAVTEDNRRWLRLVRAASQGKVIGGPGFPGYMLLRAMSAEQFTHWKNSMQSQAREMLDETIRIEKLYHKLIAA